MIHAVVLIAFRVPFTEVEPIVPSHRAFLQEGYDAGMLLCSGPLSPRTGGVVVARGESRSQIEEYFSKDPYALRGVADHTVLEFDPVKFQPFLHEWIQATEGGQ